jgi:hypothetical protein
MDHACGASLFCPCAFRLAPPAAASAPTNSRATATSAKAHARAIWAMMGPAMMPAMMPTCPAAMRERSLAVANCTALRFPFACDNACAPCARMTVACAVDEGVEGRSLKQHYLPFTDGLVSTSTFACSLQQLPCHKHVQYKHISTDVSPAPYHAHLLGYVPAQGHAQHALPLFAVSLFICSARQKNRGPLSRNRALTLPARCLITSSPASHAHSQPCVLLGPPVLPSSH